MQVVATVSLLLGAPRWVGRKVLALLAIGFVPALVFSWVYELTSEGVKRDGEVPSGASVAPQTARRMDRMIIVVLLLALGYFAVDKFVLAPERVADATTVSTPAGIPTSAGTDAPASAPSTATPAEAQAAAAESSAHSWPRRCECRSSPLSCARSVLPRVGMSSLRPTTAARPSTGNTAVSNTTITEPPREATALAPEGSTA